jgi:hypothetical protein
MIKDMACQEFSNPANLDEQLPSFTKLQSIVSLHISQISSTERMFQEKTALRFFKIAKPPGSRTPPTTVQWWVVISFADYGSKES